jgi:DNA-directed RNA polymerase subunit RPC12/RpoP
MLDYDWQDLKSVGDKHYKCGYCGHEIAPNEGYHSRDGDGTIYICPNCRRPTFFDYLHVQTPKIRLGNEVGGISDKGVESLYNEARDCTSVGAYTASVMVCRKILMNFAVAQKAKPGETFAFYVTYLSDNGYIPPQGKPWVDQIRQRGNDANHEIMLMHEGDADLILHFTEALLRFNYELPSILAADAAKKAKSTP